MQRYYTLIINYKHDEYVLQSHYALLQLFTLKEHNNVKHL